MSAITVTMVDDAAGLEMVQGLCWEWFDWNWKFFPVEGPRENHPLDPETYPAVVASLPVLHARPTGAMILATINSAPAGCVMYRALRPGVAEFNRLFVSETARGHGIGRLLLDHMFEAMRADGYQTVHFSSARFLTHARALYESMGFNLIPTPDEVSEEHRQIVYFMERSLI